MELTENIFVVRFTSSATVPAPSPLCSTMNRVQCRRVWIKILSTQRSSLIECVEIRSFPCSFKDLSPTVLKNSQKFGTQHGWKTGDRIEFGEITHSVTGVPVVKQSTDWETMSVRFGNSVISAASMEYRRGDDNCRRAR